MKPTLCGISKLFVVFRNGAFRGGLRFLSLSNFSSNFSPCLREEKIRIVKPELNFFPLDGIIFGTLAHLSNLQIFANGRVKCL